jgi:hypothetical protein
LELTVRTWFQRYGVNANIYHRRTDNHNINVDNHNINHHNHIYYYHHHNNHNHNNHTATNNDFNTGNDDNMGSKYHIHDIDSTSYYYCFDNDCPCNDDNYFNLSFYNNNSAGDDTTGNKPNAGC